MLMQPGFAFLESGMIRSTNAINVLFKNVIDIALGGIFFFLVGYSLMWNSSEFSSELRGAFTIAWGNYDNSLTGVSPSVHFLFQFGFAMTAATICSGAVAGRIQLWAYFSFAILMTSIIYPIGGYWAWSKYGWLASLGFHDFAGSAVVHAVGGFAALAGAIALKPRIGKFDREDHRLVSVQGKLIKDRAHVTRYSQSVVTIQVV